MADCWRERKTRFVWHAALSKRMSLAGLLCDWASRVALAVCELGGQCPFLHFMGEKNDTQGDTAPDS